MTAFSQHWVSGEEKKQTWQSLRLLASGGPGYLQDGGEGEAETRQVGCKPSEEKRALRQPPSPLPYSLPLPRPTPRAKLESCRLERLKVGMAVVGPGRAHCPNALPLPFLVLFWAHGQPGSQTPGGRLRGSFPGKLNRPREMTYMPCYCGSPQHQSQNSIPSFFCETHQEINSAPTQGFHQLWNTSLLNRTRQLSHLREALTMKNSAKQTNSKKETSRKPR